MPTTMSKDPASFLPFSCDWSAWLAAEDDDTIVVSTWTPATGITVAVSPAPSVTAGKATVWLSGGTAGTTYEVVNRIVTTGGRTDERTIRVHVYDR